MIAAFTGVSMGLIDSLAVRTVVRGVAVIGIWFVWWRSPTRDDVLAKRGA